MADISEYARILNPSPGYGPGVRVKAYDFTRPDKFSKEQLRTMSIISEGFARLSQVTLSSMLTKMAEIRVSLVDQLAFYELTDTLTNPTVIGILDMSPLKGRAAMQLDMGLAGVLIDLLTGGEGRDAQYDRAPDDLEEELLSHAFSALLSGLGQAWKQVLNLTPLLLGLESNPLFAQIIPPTEMIILVELDVLVGDQSGKIRLIYPYLTIQPIIPRLSASYWYSRTVGGNQPAGEGIPLRLPVEIDFRICLPSLSVQELKNLKAGSVLEIDPLHLQTVCASVAGDELFSAEWLEPSVSKPCSFAPHAAEGSLKPESEMQSLAARLSGEIREHSTRLGEQLQGEIRNLVSALDRRVISPASLTDSDDGASYPGGVNREKGVFSAYTVENGEFLYAMLKKTHPQIQAAVLSRVSSPLAADFMARLETSQRAEVLQRLSSLRAISHPVMVRIEDFLARRLERFDADGMPGAGGIDKAVEILNFVPAQVERSVIEHLDEINPELSEEFKKRMFVFDDLVLVDPRAVKKLAAMVSHDDLAMAMKSARQETREHLAHCLGDEEFSVLTRLSSELGPVRLREVDAAQMRIIAALKDLEQAGEVLIARPGEVVE